MSIQIRFLTPNHLEEALAHFRRHRIESGQNKNHFMPFSPNDKDRSTELDLGATDLPVTIRGWQRWFLAFNASDQVIGHVDLKGDALKTGLHRCELGIGIEQEYRGTGLGKRLMLAAIEFARDVDSLSWIDLRVFAHNAAARSLYQSVGFHEVGTVTDRFRIDGERIDDISMVLSVG